MRKTKVKMNKPVYLGLSILEISKTLMHKFCHDYIKPKYQRSCIQWDCIQNIAKLCYMYTDSFIIYIKTEDFYKDIANDVEKRFDTSEYRVNRTLPVDKNHIVYRLMKDELGGKIMIQFAVLRQKTYSYLMDHGKNDSGTHVIKKDKGVKKCIIKKYFNLMIIKIAY